ncbi:MAG: hypothetical protein AVDCRST_MAG49-4746, partial [uncultured Thermomicrobiales bacterium]
WGIATVSSRFRRVGPCPASGRGTGIGQVALPPGAPAPRTVPVVAAESPGGCRPPTVGRRY